MPEIFLFLLCRLLPAVFDSLSRSQIDFTPAPDGAGARGGTVHARLGSAFSRQPFYISTVVIQAQPASNSQCIGYCCDDAYGDPRRSTGSFPSSGTSIPNGILFPNPNGASQTCEYEQRRHRNDGAVFRAWGPTAGHAQPATSRAMACPYRRRTSTCGFFLRRVPIRFSAPWTDRVRPR